MAAGAAMFVLAAGPAAADERLVLGTGLTVVQRTSPEAVDRPLLGPTISGTFLELGRETWRLRPGFEAQITSTFRSDSLWIGDVSVAWVATLVLTELAVNPFVSFGPDVAFVAAEGDQDARWAIGVRGDVGLHGILFEALYWRAKVGFVAVGVAGIRSELLVGYAID